MPPCIRLIASPSGRSIDTGSPDAGGVFGELADTASSWSTDVVAEEPAELLMLGDTTGRIEEGFEADMILVPSNPLEDISALQDVLLVMSNGQVALKRIPFAKQ